MGFRRSAAFKAEPEAVAAWLRLGELEAAELATEPYDKNAFKDLLNEIRTWTVEPFPDVEQRFVETCAAAGVAVVLVPELLKIHLSGVARWLHKDEALIQLSLRDKTEDHLWFSFFHEAGHILFHSRRSRSYPRRARSVVRPRSLPRGCRMEGCRDPALEPPMWKS